MKPRILIVGAGIGGLTLAHALRQRGLSFDIVDHVPRWGSVGAGFGLWSNALRVFDRLGLLERVIAPGVPFTGGDVTDTQGRLLTRVRYTSADARIPVGVALLRYELHEVLREGIDVRLGTTIESRDGYDLVVGADGVHSRVRELFWGPVELRDSGYTSWRFVVPIALPLEGPTEMWGAGKRTGLVAMTHGRTYAFATTNVPPTFDDPLPGRLGRFRENFRGFGEPFRSALAALTRDDELIHARLGDLRLPAWTKPGAVLLGDAAHAMTPNIAQGAAMAIEDAWVLADCISRGAINDYEMKRRARVEWVQNLSWRFGVVGQWSSPLAVAARNAALRLTPRSAAPRQLASLLNGGPC